MRQLATLFGLAPFVPPDGILQTRVNVLDDKDRNQKYVSSNHAAETKKSQILKLIQEGTKLRTDEISELLDVSVSSINRVKKQSRNSNIAIKCYVSAKTMGAIQDAIAANPVATQDRIAQITGFAVATVKNAIRKLRQDGLQTLKDDSVHTRYVSERILDKVRFALSVNPRRFANLRGGVSITGIHKECGISHATISATIKFLIDMGEIPFLEVVDCGTKKIIKWKD
jgi:Mn-dependent DtxR family transcriptional regulator